MNKKIVTWAVAALFAVPAVPMFAKTIHSKKLTHTSKVHAKTLTSSTKHRTSHHHKKHHTPLVSSAHAGKHLSHSLTATKHTVTRTSRTSTHSAKAASSIHPTVMMHNQPTIDAMHT